MKASVKAFRILSALFLLAFSVYALLDTFLIPRVYACVESPAAAAEESCRARTLSAAVGESEKEPQITGNSYSDGSLSVEISSYRVEDTTVYVADIRIEDPETLRTAFSQNSYGRNITAVSSDTAESVGAVLAVNGDNYGSREKGYVIRNGVLYRELAAPDQEDLVIWSDGSFSIIREAEISARELLEQGAWQVFSFGPGLLEEGELLVDARDEVDRAKTSNPRTALGQIGEGHYVLVVSDGRSDESEGLSLYELAQFLQQLGVETAYNLDGGGSSTMVFLGQVVNRPVGGRGSGERAVTDIVYV
jgi:exopolysaccharide biosynthesis protein